MNTLNHEEWMDWWVSRRETYFTDKTWEFSRLDLITRLNVTPTTPVLEIGYGYGRELSRWCERSSVVYGVELHSQNQDSLLERIKKNRGSTSPILDVYDGRHLPYEEGKFGVVYSCFVMQHLSRAHIELLLSETIRVLSHDGLMLHEFFGDPMFLSKGGEDVFSGVPGEGGMFNNALTTEEITDISHRIGAELEWIEPWPITKQWSNNWLCARKRMP